MFLSSLCCRKSPCVYAVVAIRKALDAAFCSRLSGVSWVGKIQSPGSFVVRSDSFFPSSKWDLFRAVWIHTREEPGSAGIWKQQIPPQLCGCSKSNFTSFFLSFFMKLGFVCWYWVPGAVPTLGTFHEFGNEQEGNI